METYDAYSIVIPYDKQLGVSSKNCNQLAWCLFLAHSYTISDKANCLGITTSHSNQII